MQRDEVSDDFMGGILGSAPNDNYRKFFSKFAEINSVGVESWKPYHLIAYFSKCYKQTYGTDYKFKFNSPTPSKCFEVFQVKKLALSLSSRPEIIRQYIDWSFDKVKREKRRVTSISFMTSDAMLSEYKRQFSSMAGSVIKLDRSTKLPDKYKNIVVSKGIVANNYGDLAFLSKMKQSPELVALFEELALAGFDKSILVEVV